MRWTALLALALLAGGCEKALFPEDLPRSPYERYMALRGRAAPMHEEGATGAKEPALRERLKPLDQR